MSLCQQGYAKFDPYAAVLATRKQLANFTNDEQSPRVDKLLYRIG
jgi:hypothetical protein